MERSRDKELIESVYTVALEPDRYAELTDIWKERMVESLERQAQSGDSMDDDIRRSLLIIDSLSGDDLVPASMLKDFADTRFAVLAVNAKGEILEANSAAVTAYGALQKADLSCLPYDEGSLDALRETVRQTVAGSSKPTQMIRAIKLICGGPSLISVKDGHADAGMEAYALVQTSDFIWPEHLLPILERSFGLTRAESSIIRLMTEGCSLADIAEKRESSLATVRTQVRSIFEKTGTHSQTELVRMAIAFAALGDNFESAQTSTDVMTSEGGKRFESAYPREEDRHLLTLPDGRVLDYSIIGDPKGKPVIFVHCPFFGDAWTATAVKQLTEAGLKLIAPARAYYKRSSPCPPKTSPLEVYTQDIGHLITHLKLDRFVVMTRNIGSQFGFEIMRKYPGKARALLGVSPALPFDKDEAAYAKAEPYHRFLASASFYFPKLLELFVKAGQIYYSRVPPRVFIEKSFQSAAADHHLMDDPEIMAAMTQGLAHGGENGVKAFLHTYKDVRAHTYEMILNAGFPMTIMVGAEDQAPRFGIAEAMNRDNQSIKLKKIKGVADFIFQAQPETVFETLNDLWKEYG